jgi:hypothetical protein
MYQITPFQERTFSLSMLPGNEETIGVTADTVMRIVIRTGFNEVSRRDFSIGTFKKFKKLNSKLFKNETKK